MWAHSYHLHTLIDDAFSCRRHMEAVPSHVLFIVWLTQDQVPVFTDADFSATFPYQSVSFRPERQPLLCLFVSLPVIGLHFRDCTQ